jgi:hypothetical protein
MTYPLLYPWHQLPSDYCETIEFNGHIKVEVAQILKSSKHKRKPEAVFKELKLRKELAFSQLFATDIITGKIAVLDSHGLPMKISEEKGILIQTPPMISEKIGNEWIASKGIPFIWTPSKILNSQIKVLPKARIIELTQSHWPSAEKNFNQASTNGLNDAKVSHGKYNVEMAINIAAEKGWLEGSVKDDVFNLIQKALHNAKK